METIYFSPLRNAFFPLSMKESYEDSPNGWPDDAFQIGYGIYATYTLSQPPKGKIRGVGKDGYPMWVDVPPQSQEHNLIEAKMKCDLLMDSTRARITALVEAQDDGDITESEKTELVALREYRSALRRLDISGAPKIQWPEHP